jgi:hypothetical protein
MSRREPALAGRARSTIRARYRTWLNFHVSPAHRIVPTPVQRPRIACEAAAAALSAPRLLSVCLDRDLVADVRAGRFDRANGEFEDSFGPADAPDHSPPWRHGATGEDNPPAPIRPVGWR